jgi:cyclopropane-fatty-acyl-phospholipid synthase
MSKRRLEALRRFLDHVHSLFALQFGFMLWDGSTVPENWARDGLSIFIADEGAVAGLVRRPNLRTFANLWASARLDIRNGTIFDLVARRPSVRTRDIRKVLKKSLLLRTAAHFLFASRGGPWPLEEIGENRKSTGSAAENKKNISYHYDVSNAFYELWLDPEMVYSCSYFTSWDNSLEQAQRDKLDMCCRKLRLQPGEMVLDVGCGWGAFLIHAAMHYGVSGYGVTLSEQQLSYAKEKIERLGLKDRVRVELKDYAAIDGVFDKAVSIGMAEHVGLDNLSGYFSTLHRALRPGGLYLHHAITRPGKSGQVHKRRKRPEFAALTQYIFPGGELDTIGRTVTRLEATGFEIHDVEGWREHYQRTCRHWHDRLLSRMEAAIADVGSVKARVWLMYLAGCSLAFERNNVGLYQTLASKRVKGASGLPPTRADLYR